MTSDEDSGKLQQSSDDLERSISGEVGRTEL